MDSYGPSVLSGGNTAANQLDFINRRNAETMTARSVPNVDSMISKYGGMDDMASEFIVLCLEVLEFQVSLLLLKIFAPEELSGFLPRTGRESIESVRQRIVDGIPADYEGGVEQFAEIIIKHLETHL